MSLFELIIIALSLSMDSFAISIANGIVMPHISFVKALKIAVIIGAYHILMTLGGFHLAHLIDDSIDQYDHWIAFGLLAFIGVKMIYEAIKQDSEMTLKSNLDNWQIHLQALATSIDAFAVGMSLAFLKINIFNASFIIGFICFLAVMVGLRAGKSIGSKLSHYMEIAGGVLLVVIGMKILFEHF